MRSILILMVGVLLGLPVVTNAADWIRGCKESSSGVLATTATPGVFESTGLRPGQFACAETLTQTDNTDVLYIGDCAAVQVFQFDDPDGDADNSTVQGTPQLCPTLTPDDQACDTVPGGSILTGNDANYDVTGVWFRVVASGTTDTALVRWVVLCSNSARP